MNEAAAREEVLALMSQLETRPIHVQHVTRLALQLFDGLVALHGLGPRERLLLEAASCLHDIGHQYDYTGMGHHKESARLIREHSWRQFSRPEVELIAQVARYHRKSMPSFKHEDFRALPDSDRRIVQCLAGVLRLADSLDRTHEQVVARLAVELLPGSVALHLESTGQLLREVMAARQKADLARLVFQREFVFLADGQPVPVPPTPGEPEPSP
jgi:exopolyphosphatase / guanosine-5'-triphosphate,3'-diphosphate pyrophosphatase